MTEPEVPEGYFFVGVHEVAEVSSFRIPYVEVFRGPGGSKLERGREGKGGRLVIEEFTLDGMPHRDDGGPTRRVHRSPTGDLTEVYLREEWWSEEKRHRVGGPAEVIAVGGVVHEQTWWVNDLRSRIEGPATIAAVFRIGSSGPLESWWLRGVPTSKDGMPEALERLTREEFAEELGFSVFGNVLADGYLASDVITAITEGVTTGEGLRARLDGAPLEWVQSFESGEALGFATAGSS